MFSRGGAAWVPGQTWSLVGLVSFQDSTRRQGRGGHTRDGGYRDRFLKSCSIRKVSGLAGLAKS